MKDDDRDLFRRSVGRVTRLDQDKIEHDKKKPKPVARFRRRDEETVLVDSLTGDLDPADLETGDELMFRRPSLPSAQFRMLRRGRYSVEGEVDLHGLTANEAHDLLAQYLTEAGHEGMRCVRVIHGKGLRSGPGGPVIKKQVGRWLRRRADVLAYCSSVPSDGGTGALYVLLHP